MRKQLLALAISSGLLVVAAPVVADHNSKNGEGWANMPNDIHNTRIETRESGDNEAFKDFVKQGEGSKTVNRFDSDETQPKRATLQKGEARKLEAGTGNKGESRAREQTRSQAVQQRKQRRIETRSRVHTDAASMSRAGLESGGQRGGSRRSGRH